MSDRSKLVGTATVVVAALVLLAMAYTWFSSPRGRIGSCECPEVGMSTTQQPEGYEVMISNVSGAWELSDFKVLILTEDDPWPEFPKVLAPGHIGQGPYGEYANFTDFTSQGTLSLGDFITLQGLRSGTQYRVILIWALQDTELDSAVITVP